MTVELMEPTLKRPRDEQEDIDGVLGEECITFHLLKRSQDGNIVMEENAHFPPSMTHQLFGPKEVLRGFEGLDIDIYLTPRFQSLVDIKWSFRKPNTPAFIDSEGNQHFDITAPFRQTFQASMFTEKPEFDQALANEPILDVSELGEEIVRHAVDSETGSGEILVYHSQISTATGTLKHLHACLQPLLVFFIDAASAIEQEDPKWELLLCVERSSGGEIEVVGFATCYKFYVYPDRCRYRLSQILILPPHQGKGIGSLLLEAVYARSAALNAIDFTFEDPTEVLQRMRDRLDLANLQGCQWAMEAATTALKAVATSKGKEHRIGGDVDHSAGGALSLPLNVRDRMQKELRLSKSQARRVWEVLLYAAAQESGQESAVLSSVEGTIKSSVKAAQKGVENKRVEETESGFVMYRRATTKKSAIPAAPVEEASREQKEAEIEAAIKQRIDEIRAVFGDTQEDENE